QAERGERQMLPPTVATLAALRPFATVAEALAASAGRSMAPVRPTLRLGEDGSVAVELPDGTLAPIPRSMFP
ncbi:MAG: hypothetical protein J0H43_12850, partial [Actinobacteria bacterium]|nr:hypothetical protein [Actinomycetota bacterium]